MPEEIKHTQEIEISYGVEETNVTKRFFCPITHQLLEEPVMASDGKNYEREAIEEWINRAKRLGQTPRSPSTNLPLQSLNLYPNFDLKGEIESIKPNSIWKALFELEEGALLEVMKDHSDPYDPIPDPEKRTALMYAALTKRHKVLEYLLARDEHGQPKASSQYVNLQDSTGHTALMLACSNREINLETIKCLVENGADPNILSKKHKQTALMLAVLSRRSDVVEYLLARDGNKRRVPTQVDLQDSSGYSALMLACSDRETKLEIIKWLLGSGARVRLQGKDGKTILTLLGGSHREDIKNYILDFFALRSQHQQPSQTFWQSQQLQQNQHQQPLQQRFNQPLIQQRQHHTYFRTNASFPLFENEPALQQAIEQSILAANQHNPSPYSSATHSSSRMNASAPNPYLNHSLSSLQFEQTLQRALRLLNPEFKSGPSSSFGPSSSSSSSFDPRLSSSSSFGPSSSSSSNFGPRLSSSSSFNSDSSSRPQGSNSTGFPPRFSGVGSNSFVPNVENHVSIAFPSFPPFVQPVFPAESENSSNNPRRSHFNYQPHVVNPSNQSPQQLYTHFSPIPLIDQAPNPPVYSVRSR